MGPILSMMPKSPTFTQHDMIHDTDNQYLISHGVVGTGICPYSTGNGVRVGYPMRMKSTQKMKCTWPTQEICIWDATWRQGLVSGVTQILGLASGVTQILALVNAKIYQHVGIFCVR